jgi:hypothetical protein
MLLICRNVTVAALNMTTPSQSYPQVIVNCTDAMSPSPMAGNSRSIVVSFVCSRWRLSESGGLP